MVKVAKLRDCCSISDYRLQQQKVEELKLRYEQVTFITAFLLQRIYYNDVFDWLSCSILVPFVFHSCSIRALCVLHSCSMRAPCVLHSCSISQWRTEISSDQLELRESTNKERDCWVDGMSTKVKNRTNGGTSKEKRTK